MKRVFVCLFVVCGSISFAQQASSAPSDNAPIQRLLRFSGTLAPVPQSAMVGAVTLRFSLYDQPAGGTPYWQETQSVHPDAQGHYTVLLGETTPGGFSSSVFTSHREHWLGVQPSGNPEQLRVLLVELPLTDRASSSASATYINNKAIQLNTTERRITLLLSVMFLVGLLLACSEIRKWWKARTELYGEPPFAKLLNAVPFLGRILGVAPASLPPQSESLRSVPWTFPDSNHSLNDDRPENAA